MQDSFGPAIQEHSARVALYLAPILLGGWFLFTAIAAYASLPSKSVALPETGKAELMMDDFVVFYAAGKHVSEVKRDVYEPTVMAKLEAQETGQDPDKVLTLPFFNPPSALLPFSLFAQIPLGLAAGAWLVSTAVLAVASMKTLGSRLPIPTETALLLVLGVASSLPLYQAIVHGQMTFLLLAGFCLFGVSVLRSGSDRYAVAGLVLLALKPIFLPVPLFYLLMQRRYQPLVAFAGLECTLVLAAAALFGPSLPVDYLKMSWHALGWDEVNGISTYGMFGWNGLWRGLLGTDVHDLQLLLTALSAAATVGAFAWTLQRADRPRLVLAAMVLAALLISPHSYAQDLLLLTIPLVLLFDEYRGSSIPHFAATVAWFAAYLHFETLAFSGVGAANIFLVLFAFILMLKAASPRIPQLIHASPSIPASRRLDVDFAPADAAGS